jgi:protease IV
MLRTPHKALASFILLASLVWTSGAYSGTSAPSARSVYVPWADSVDQDSGAAVFNHSAGLAYSKGSSLGVGFSVLADGAGDGDAFFGMASTSLGPIHLGLGVARLTGGGLTKEVAFRTDVGMALSLGANASVGVGWHGFASDDQPALATYQSWSLSTHMRPLRSLALALDLDRLNTPSLEGQAQPVHGRFGLALRPGTERLSVGLNASTDFSDAPEWSVGGSLRTMFFDGFTLGAFGRYVDEKATGGHVEWGLQLALGQGGVALSTGLHAAVGEGMRISNMLSVSTQPKASLVAPSGQLVVLELAGSLPERPPASLFGKQRPAFAHWLAALDSMASDASVAGVLMRIRRAPNWTQCWELRQAIHRLKGAGKKVYARLTVGDMRSVYLASAADKIYLDPSGALMLTGLSITKTYLADAMGKLGVRAQFIKYEDHKTYPERFTRTGPSDPSSKQTKALLTHFISDWSQAVSTGRNITDKALQAILENGPLTMKDAVEQGLVDDLVDNEALKKVIEKDMGRELTLSRGYRPGARGWERWGQQDRIAIVPIVGSIVDGKTSTPLPLVRGLNTGERSLVATLRRVEKDASYAGAVIRIDSPGGGVVASDLMYRAIKRLAKKKPVVVSFGNVAASGGYYAAMGAKTIFASPMTITGSVGIFAGKADLSGMYQKLGLTTHTTSTHTSADLLSMSRPWTDTEIERLQRQLGAYYQRFLDLVAKSRGFSNEEARARAGGRVFDGTRALDLKMVDSHGTLWDAVEQVRKDAGLRSFSLSYVPETGGLTRFLSSLGLGKVTGPTPSITVPAILQPLSDALTAVFGAGSGSPMTRLPFHVEVQ